MLVKIKTDRPFFYNQAKISQIIADFWDKTSEGWLAIWGPHLHHGYYEDGKKFTPVQAQENLLHQLTAQLDIPAGSFILDVGCGMGGSSLYLAKKYDAIVTGVTLSQKQIALAQRQSQRE